MKGYEFLKTKPKDELPCRYKPLSEWLMKICIDGDKLTYRTNETETEIINDRTNSRYVIMRRKKE